MACDFALISPSYAAEIAAVASFTANLSIPTLDKKAWRATEPHTLTNDRSACVAIARVPTLPGGAPVLAREMDSGCRDVITTTREGSGYCVNWRYVTRDRQYVMVRDTHQSILRGGWVFVHISAFAKGRSTWRGIYDRGACKQIGASP